jgi:2-polyprenyl-3-methyl-5-hydroxy-6-metoxy-1,4-benzoquinol methylase
MPTAEDLKAFYAQDYRREYKKVTAPKPKHILRAGKAALDRASFLLSIVKTPPKSLLDIGAGGGEFLYLVDKLGFQGVCGIEPNIGYCRHAQTALGVNVANIQMQELEGQFESITLFHVMEHLLDPVDVFERLNNLLAPSGILFIEVPWIESVCQSPTNIYFKAHTYYFSASTLAACASKYFTTKRVDTSTGNLRIVFEKLPTPTAMTLPGKDLVASLQANVLGHGWFRYLTVGSGSVKLIKKIGQSFSERKVRDEMPKQILDALVA